MTDLSRLMSIGRGALSSQQSRLESSQHNIANASTPGYTRQRVDLVTLGGQYGGAVRGVRADGPYAQRTSMYDRQIAFNEGERGFHSAASQSASALEASLFPDAEAKTAMQVGEFFDALGALSAQPGDPVRRRDVLARAESVASAFNRDAGILQREMTSLNKTLESDVDELNANLNDIARLDKEIKTAVASGKSADDIIDLRDTVVASVTSAMDVQVVGADDGTVQLVTSDGRALVEDGNVREVGLRRNGSSLEVTLDGVAGPEKMDDPGGAIGGRLFAHNDVTLSALDTLNTQASEFATAVNTAHSAGVGLDGVNGRNLFDAAGAGGAAAAMQIDAAVAGNPDALGMSSNGQPGDSGALRAIMDVRDAALPNGSTIEDGLRAMQQSLGETIASSNRATDLADGALSQLESFRDSVEGVSLEEEMITLMEAQRGFDAALKVISATDEMFNSLMNMKT